MTDLPTGLPQEWEVRHSNSKNLPYYFNSTTKESRWEPPSGTDTDTLKTYIAAKHSTSAQPSAGGGGGGSTEGKIRAAHLLVKHRESRRPKSWREDPITRTKDEARDILAAHEKKIRAGDAQLSELATKESDCSSAHKGGDLGYFRRGEMQKAFEDAAFALNKGEMSGIVETESGVHLIQRLD